jgi:hypothetical protein
MRKVFKRNAAENELINIVRFQVLMAASMKFRIVFWDVLPCKVIFENYFTRQYIPEGNSELNKHCSLVGIKKINRLFGMEPHLRFKPVVALESVPKA